MRLYLAGPMRGYPRLNFDAFDRATERLRGRGYSVQSPAENDRQNGFDPVTASGGLGLRQVMADDLGLVCLWADAVIVLHGWETSRGALAEALAAWAIDKPVYRYGAFMLGGPSATKVTPYDLSN